MNKRALAYLAAIGILLVAVSMMINGNGHDHSHDGHSHSDGGHRHGDAGSQSGEVFKVLHDDTHLMQAMMRVEGGRLLSEPVRLTVKAGEPAFIEIWVDHDDEIHVHGINAVLPLEAGMSNRIQLQTAQTGAFELELHNSPVVLGVLEVYP